MTAEERVQQAIGLFKRDKAADPPLFEQIGMVMAGVILEAVAEEREACAKVVAEATAGCKVCCAHTREVSAAIRARR